MVSSARPQSSFRILLVEDNPADVRLMRELLEPRGLSRRLHVARDGREASDYLFGMVAAGKTKRPDLIILDLNLPKKSGRTLLKELKEHPWLRCIPVLVITTSGADEDVCGCYELHANGFITKPSQLSQFENVIQAIELFWFQTVQLPRFTMVEGGKRNGSKESA